MDEDLWLAVDSLSNIWTRLDLVEQFKALLPRNEFLTRFLSRAGTRNFSREPIAEVLENANAGFAGLFDNPFLLAARLPLALSVGSNADMSSMSGLSAAWLAAAQNIERAQLLSIEWLRSRLPRYPLIPAPQFARGGTLTAPTYASRIVWNRSLARLGYQLGDVPEAVPAALDASSIESGLIRSAIRDLQPELASTQEWSRFVAADQLVDATVREELLACRARIRERLKSASTARALPDNFLDAQRYRDAITSEEVNELSEISFEYTKAFGELDTLIDFAAGRILSQLVCYPVLTISASDLSVRPGRFTHITFSSTRAAPFSSCGSVVWLDDTLIQDAVYLTSETFSFNIHGERSDFAATVLNGTDVLRPPMA